MGAPRACADERLSRSRIPAPADGTKPPAVALIGREAFSGASLNARESTFIASAPAQEYFEYPSDPPASIRFARPSRIRMKASTTASLPVLHALELVDTWFPRASKPATRALLPLMKDCSIELPRRRTLPALTSGTTFSARTSTAPHPVPMIAPLSQSTSSDSGEGRANPASVQASIE